MDIKKHPKLEDLLKLKKAEQPDNAFWEKFDRDLQNKALQTFIEREPWYRNWANLASHYARSLSMACGLLFLMAIGMALYLNIGPENIGLERGNFASGINSQEKRGVLEEGALASDEFIDYAVVANDTLEKDYAVEVIAIKGASETYDFEADAISVAIGDTVDYSDAPVYASSDTLRISKQYTQLANFAF